MSKTLFDPVQVGAWKLSNRVVMAPLTRNRAPGSIPTPIMATYYGQRANPVTGAGLIVSEGTPVCDQGYGYSDTPGIHTPEQVEAWKPVTAAVRAQGGHIVCQIWHVGRISHVELQPNGQAPVAPSAVRADAKCYLIKDENGQRSGGFVDCSEPRALTVDEIAGVVESFAQGANTYGHGPGGVGGVLYNTGAYHEFIRHPSGQPMGLIGGGNSNMARYQAATTKVRTYSSQNDYSDAVPGCLSCHKAHGNMNPFGLVFLNRNAAAVNEEGGFAAGQTPPAGDYGMGFRNLCGQCHVQGN